MGEDSQFIVPASFIALYTAPGRPRPWAPREEIAQRYDFCEDLAQMLTEPARNQHWELGITETDVLERIGRGLAIGDPAPAVSGVEATWVVRRLAELLDWPDPQTE